MREEDQTGDTIEALREERDLLRALIGSTPHFFVVIDAEGGTRLMNPAMLAALGYTEEQVIGTRYLETFVLKEDREALAEVFERIVTGRQQTLNENHVLTKEGQSLLVQWHGTPMYDAEGEFIYFFGVGTDITEVRHRDHLLAERDARYRAIFAHSRDPVIFADSRGRILDANAAAESQLGWRDWELRRMGAADLGLPFPVAGRTRATVHHKSGTGLPFEVRTSTFEADGAMHALYLLMPDAG